jgi:hypothetical protein
MVERERKGHAATVEEAKGKMAWMQRYRQLFMLALSAAAFAVLLSE